MFDVMMNPQDDAGARLRDAVTDAWRREGIARTARTADVGVLTLRAFLAGGRTQRLTLSKLWRWASTHGDEQLRELAAVVRQRHAVAGSGA
jgi:hypothetical protein